MTTKCIICSSSYCKGMGNPEKCPHYDEIVDDIRSETKEEDDFKGIEIQGKAEVKYNIKIKIKKAVEDKINWLTQNYEDEISAFLTGEIKDGEIIIDGLLFPYQDVSSGSVEVEPKDLVKLRKEYGDECLRIIGHWHSHNNMGAFWSGTDDTFIDSYSITKPISIFLVSSTLGRCRVMLVMNKPFNIRLDNLDYEIIWDDDKFEEDLKKIIETKITKRVVSIQSFSHSVYGSGHNNSQIISLDSDTKKEEIKIKVNEAICYNAKNGILAIKNLDMLQAETLSNDTKFNKPEVKKLSEDDFMLVYKTENNKKAVELIEEIKFYLEEIFGEEINIQEYGQSGYCWGE